MLVVVGADLVDLGTGVEQESHSTNVTVVAGVVKDRDLEGAVAVIPAAHGVRVGPKVHTEEKGRKRVQLTFPQANRTAMGKIASW